MEEVDISTETPQRFTFLAHPVTLVVFGFVLAYAEAILLMLAGKNVVDAIWPHAVRSLEWTMAMRSSSLLTASLLVMPATLTFLWRQHVSRSEPTPWMERVLVVGMGFILGLLSIHFVMDIAYLRGAFLLLPTLLGWWLGCVLVAIGGLPSLREPGDDKVRFGRLSHIAGVFFAAWLVMPGVPALVGMAPSPPDAPVMGYGSTPGPYDTVRFASPYTMPASVVEVQGNLEDDVAFSVHLTLPELPADTPLTSIPLAVLLHGFGYPDVNAYDAWITHLSAKGMAVAFIQYPSDLRPDGHDSVGETGPNGQSDFLQHTYRNTAIRAALDHLADLALGEARDVRVDEVLGEVVIDPSTLWTGGHSLGAAYTFLVLDEVLQRGWAQHGLVVALEAPAHRPSQSELQPNLSGLPNQTLVQISVAQDDMSVGVCPGAFHQQQFNHIDSERNQLIEVQTDKYGFPRLVASHYMPTDPARDRLADWGFYRRLDAQADYAVALSRNDTFTADFAFNYLTDETMLTTMGTWSDGTPVLPLRLYHDGLNTAQRFATCE